MRFALPVVAMACGAISGIGGCSAGSGAGTYGLDAGTGATGVTPTIGTGGQGGRADLPGVGGQAGQAAADDLAAIMASYRSWHPLSDAPVDISADIFMLCRSPTATESAFAASVHGRHALRDWANPLAMEGIGAKGAGGFAIGAAIVKEKFVLDPTSGTSVLAALGIMVKRLTGFDPAGGDWEFVYWNAADGVSRGPVQLATCTSCHAAAGATDLVFLDGTWRTSSGP